MNRRDLLKYAGAAGLCDAGSPTEPRREGQALATKPARRLIVAVRPGWLGHDLRARSEGAVRQGRRPGRRDRRRSATSTCSSSERGPKVTDYFADVRRRSPRSCAASRSRASRTRECMQADGHRHAQRGQPGSGRDRRARSRQRPAAAVSHPRRHRVHRPVRGQRRPRRRDEPDRRAARSRAGVPTARRRAPFTPSERRGRDPHPPRQRDRGSHARRRAARSATTAGASMTSPPSIDRGKRLKPKSRAGFGKRGRTLALDNQVDLALDAIQQDISQAVMLNTRLQWDTHDTNTDQAGFHDATFTGLSRLLAGLTTRARPHAGLEDDRRHDRRLLLRVLAHAEAQLAGRQGSLAGDVGDGDRRRHPRRQGLRRQHRRRSSPTSSTSRPARAIRTARR